MSIFKSQPFFFSYSVPSGSGWSGPSGERFLPLQRVQGSQQDLHQHEGSVGALHPASREIPAGSHHLPAPPRGRLPHPYLLREEGRSSVSVQFWVYVKTLRLRIWKNISERVWLCQKIKPFDQVLLLESNKRSYWPVLMTPQGDGQQRRRRPTRSKCVIIRSLMIIIHQRVASSCYWLFVVSPQPPMPTPPEEETDEEKGLRRLFDQLAGSVRKQQLHLRRSDLISQQTNQLLLSSSPAYELEVVKIAEHLANPTKVQKKQLDL